MFDPRRETDDGNPPRRPIHPRLSRSRSAAGVARCASRRDCGGAALPAAHAAERQALVGRDDELRAAIHAKPDYAEAHYTLGTVLKQEGKLQDAAAELREAIRLQPDFAGAHTTLAAVFRQMGDPAGAATESRLGEQISKDKTNLQGATFNTNSGKRLLQVGDLEGAISQFRSAIKLAPDYAPAHFQLAEALRRKGDKAEAEKEFQKAAQLDPRLKVPAP